MCSWVFLVPLQSLTLWCVSLARAMVCSQRTASLSQSPRVGFLSSLLPQSKKSPSRLSPAQGPPQAQSSAKKDSLSSQVSVGLAFVVLVRVLLPSHSQVFVQDSHHRWMHGFFSSGPNFRICCDIPNLFLLFFLLPSLYPLLPIILD